MNDERDPTATDRPVFIGCVLLLGLLGMLPVVGSAVGIADGHAETVNCGDNDEAVGILPTGETVGSDNSTELHAGTTFGIAVCRDGSLNESLDVKDNEAYTQLEQETAAPDHDDTVWVRVTGSFNGSDAVDGVEDGFTIELAETAASTEFTEQIQFATESDAEELNKQVEALYDDRDDLESEREALQAEMEQLGDAPDPEAVAGLRDSAEELKDSQTAFLDSTAAVERILYDRAMNYAEATTVIEAIDELMELRTQQQDDTANVTTETTSRLESIRSDARSTMRVSVGGTVLIGLVIGAVVGAIGPYRRGREVDDFYQVTQMEYSWQVVRWPVIAGAALVAVALGFMWWFDILPGVVI